MRKSRLREIIWLSQGYVASKSRMQFKHKSSGTLSKILSICTPSKIRYAQDRAACCRSRPKNNICSSEWVPWLFTQRMLRHTFIVVRMGREGDPGWREALYNGSSDSNGGGPWDKPSPTALTHTHQRIPAPFLTSCLIRATWPWVQTPHPSQAS